MKQKWYRIVLYSIACGFQRFLLFIPRCVVRLIASFCGWSAFYILAKERKKTIRHLTYIFENEKSSDDIRRIARNVFCNLAMTVGDFALFPRLSDKGIKRLVTVEGLSHVTEVTRNQKRGLIIVTPHFGNWELLAATVVAYGFEGAVIGKELYYPGYNRLVIELRESKKVYTIYRDKAGKNILQELKKGHVIGILPDQYVDDLESVAVDFFGKPADTPIGPAKIAITAGVPIVVAFMIREGKHYRLVFDSLLESTGREGESKTDTAKRLTQAYTKVMEKYIRRYPEQWVWMHNRWHLKTK